MQSIVRASERYHSQEGWLDTCLHFSFSDYYDRSNMGWGALRVFNDDRIAPGGKFDLHPHANYEIMTVMLEGAMEHTDSAGHKGILHSIGVQAMSAGSGVYHSEANAGKTSTHSLQIWIEPTKKGGEPTWKSHQFEEAEFHNRLCPLVSGIEKQKAPLQIRQNAAVYRSRLAPGKSLSHSFSGSHAFVYVVSGKLKIGPDLLEAADSMKIKDEKKIEFEAAGSDAADFILIELP
ncbi:MAG: pirin family protein [Candidatus Marsarchaeota archaeon]|nr:pirin family protein [Candidatus Marsarchaeota archaeon]